MQGERGFCGVVGGSVGMLRRSLVALMVEAVESGLKVLVDGCDVRHDALPVGPLSVHHLIYVLGRQKRPRGLQRRSRF